MDGHEVGFYLAGVEWRSLPLCVHVACCRPTECQGLFGDKWKTVSRRRDNILTRDYHHADLARINCICPPTLNSLSG